MKKSFTLLFAGGFLLVSGATAQTVESSRAAASSQASSYQGTDSYRQASWSADERRRQPERDRNRLDTGDELLGGPVPQVERHKVRANASEDLRVVMTNSTRARTNAGISGRLPGRQAESRYGRALGRIAVVERNGSGDISTIWVQPPHDPDGELETVPVNSLSLRNGQVVVDTR